MQYNSNNQKTGGGQGGDAWNSLGRFLSELARRIPSVIAGGCGAAICIVIAGYVIGQPIMGFMLGFALAAAGLVAHVYLVRARRCECNEEVESANVDSKPQC